MKWFVNRFFPNKTTTFKKGPLRRDETVKSFIWHSDVAGYVFHKNIYILCWGYIFPPRSFLLYIYPFGTCRWRSHGTLIQYLLSLFMPNLQLKVSFRILKWINVSLKMYCLHFVSILMLVADCVVRLDLELLFHLVPSSQGLGLQVGSTLPRYMIQYTSIKQALRTKETHLHNSAQTYLLLILLFKLKKFKIFQSLRWLWLSPNMC